MTEKDRVELNWAVEAGDYAKVDDLVTVVDIQAVKDRIGWNTLLHLAACNSDLDMVKKLLQLGAVTGIKTVDTGGTALHLAIINLHEENLDLVKELVLAGEDVNEPDNDGYTPLYLAQAHERKNIETYLKTKSAAELPA